MNWREIKPLNFCKAVGAISVAALVVAFIAQYVFGMKPCVLCLYERIPYVIVTFLALLAMLRPQLSKALILLICLVFMLSTGLSLYHVGIEQHFFEPTSGCLSQIKQAVTIEDLKADLLAHQMPSCADAAFTLIGISFAGWNALLSGMLMTAALLIYP